MPSFDSDRQPADVSCERSGALVVISGPSGVGKTTIVRAVKERLGGVFSVSATTRARTAQETDGIDYFFVDESRFAAMRDAGELLEYAQVFGQYWYGTPRRPVDEALEQGELVILEIDVQGGRQIRESMPDAHMIFILPPSNEELLRRLRARGRDDDEAIQRRYAEAQSEIESARASNVYDAFIINDDLERAQDRACELVSNARGC